MLGLWLESIIYSAAGLPLVVLGLLRLETAPTVGPRWWARQAFLSEFRRRWSWREGSALILALLLWPVLLLIAMAWYTATQGRAARRVSGRSLPGQLSDQLRLYLSAGILPPWYYLFDLYEADRRAEADLYVNRFETKRGIFPLLKR